MAFKYTSIASVNALLPGERRIHESSKPELSEVTSWIVSVEALVDLALVEGGQTSPATDATQVAALDLICAREVAWQVLAKDNASAVNEEHPYHTGFEAALETLAEGGMAVAEDESGSPWGALQDSDLTVDTNEDEFFKRTDVY